jgi:glutathione S-transferase
VSEIRSIKLFHYPASRSARVRWALHETVGDGFEVENVELYDGAQYSEAYLQKNPNHCVPLLEIALADGSIFRMIESGAMVEFLMDAFPDRRLAPSAQTLSPERADYLQMLHFGSTWMDMMLWQIRIHEHVLPVRERDSRTVTRYREKFSTEVEPQIKRRLENAPYVCGETFSGADIVIGHNITWARGYKLCGDDVFRSYLSRVSKRPAFQKAFADARNFRLEPPETSPIVAKFTG